MHSAEEETSQHLLMNCDVVVSVKRARKYAASVGIKFSLEDVPGLDPLQHLDSLKRVCLEDWD